MFLGELVLNWYQILPSCLSCKQEADVVTLALLFILIASRRTSVQSAWVGAGDSLVEFQVPITRLELEPYIGSMRFGFAHHNGWLLWCGSPSVCISWGIKAFIVYNEVVTNLFLLVILLIKIEYQHMIGVPVHCSI